MSSVGNSQLLTCPARIYVPSGAAGPPPRTGVLSTQFNAQFGSPTGPGLGMLNLIIFG
jgi:hypothetical protein